MTVQLGSRRDPTAAPTMSAAARPSRSSAYPVTERDPATTRRSIRDLFA